MRTTSAYRNRVGARRLCRGSCVWRAIAGAFVLAALGAQAQNADLEVTIETGHLYLYPGQAVSYVVTVANHGPDDVVGASVSGNFPVDFVEISWVVPSTQEEGTGGLADTLDLPGGGTAAYVVRAAVGPDAAETLSVGVGVALPAGGTDPEPTNDSVTLALPVVPQQVSLVRPAYANLWPSLSASALSGGDPPDNGTAVFNGHVGDLMAPELPEANQPRFILRAASFGQPLAQHQPSPNYFQGVVEWALGELFYLPLDPDRLDLNSQNQGAAFRYINTLFQDTGGVVRAIEDRIDNDTLPYNETTDGVRALGIADEIIEALRYKPMNSDLRNLLLDIYYYRVLAKQIVAKDQVVKAYQINFSSVVDEAFGEPINKEITAYEAAAEALDGVLDPYKELLMNDFGLNTADIDPAYAGFPFGYYLFLKEVPYRSIYGSTFVEFDAAAEMPLTGDPEPVYLGDDIVPSVMYVTPTGLTVDYLGQPVGGEEGQPTAAFTISNVGGDDLNWVAKVVNPVDENGFEIEMLALDGEGDDARLTLSGTLPVGQSVDVSVFPRRNESPLLRTAIVEVTDTASGGLAYNVTVVQQGNLNPILEVPQTEAVFLKYYVLAEDVDIPVRNGGRGTLRWRATLEDTDRGTWGLAEPFTLSARSYGDYDGAPIPAKARNKTTGDVEQAGILSVRKLASSDPISGSSTYPRATIRIENLSDPADAPKYVSVYFRGDESLASPEAKSNSDVMLAVYPEEIQVGPEAVTRGFAVQDIERLTDLQVESSTSWITVLPAGAGTRFMELGIAENTSPALRIGTVTVQAANSAPASRTIAVYQEGTSATGITAAPAERYVGRLGGMAVAAAEVDLTNEDTSDDLAGFEVNRVGADTLTWSAQVITGGDWLSITSGETGVNEGEILFLFDKNLGINGRTAEILVTATGAIGVLDAVVVKVKQRAATDVPVLTGGFKDLELLFDVLRDEADVKKELAKRYALRRRDGDLDKANQLIDATVAEHAAAMNDIGSLIPDWADRVEPNSALVATYMGWQQALDELATVKAFINGNVNVLGLPKDFLFLVQEFEGQDASLFDSFDKLADYMFDGDNSSAVLASPLGQAYDKFTTARGLHGTYLNTQSELREEYRTQNLQHRKWMYDVIGTDPGDDVDNPEDASSYYDPSNSYGGDLWQQEQNIKRAKEGIRQNEAELQKIFSEIETELWRRGQEQQLNASMANVYVDYGENLALIEGFIGGINAAQALASGVADSVTEFGGANVAGGIAQAANAVIQGAGEIGKGALEAVKATRAAQESADILLLEDQILGAESRAAIDNLLGEAQLVAVQSADLALALIQEVATRQAMLDEWHYRENQMRENNAALLQRGFANPVHRMRMRDSMLQAEGSFKVAQRWVFYTIRALEYKWNTPFVHSNAAGDWSAASLFRARTALDLVHLLAAIKDFDGLLQGSARGDDRFDWFSFKTDFLGLTPVYDVDDVTELPIYAHPATGYAATATEVFQAKLEASLDPATGIITLPFSTFHDNGETFFRGPRRDPNDPQQVISRGQYLDKINWMKINLVGDFNELPDDRVSGDLTYSGGSYLRNKRVGVIQDPLKPNLITEEFTYWPVRFWVYDEGNADAGLGPVYPASWRAVSEQTAGITLTMNDAPGIEVPEPTLRIDVFREYSVACDGWALKIFTHGLDDEVLVTPDLIEDIEIIFHHYSKERPALTKSGEGDRE
jgi:hypothetical protein